MKNKVGYSRYSIVIGVKSVTHNVTRNFFRRRFYDLIQKYIFCKQGEHYDYVFVVKKKTKLDKKNESCKQDFLKDVQFLLKKILPKQK